MRYKFLRFREQGRGKRQEARGKRQEARGKSEKILCTSGATRGEFNS
ncbi:MULTISPECIES: hypothetical protein [unclassified Moorena]|nr:MULTISPECIES: hypothetical protein [unclassified Moorena]NER86218.1 hypothetical protein [Moorena sp. SIO3A2]NES43001.1 hypothetical protein [Moorena sp. SIO2C4]